MHDGMTNIKYSVTITDIFGFQLLQKHLISFSVSPPLYLLQHVDGVQIDVRQAVAGVARLVGDGEAGSPSLGGHRHRGDQLRPGTAAGRGGRRLEGGEK